MKYNRDFKGVWIPAEIWLNEKINLQEKCFLTEIDSLDNEEGCFASNKHFSEFFGLSKSRVSQVINSLIDKGLILAEYEKDGKEIKKRILKVKQRVFNILNTRSQYPKQGSQYPKQGYLGYCEDNNTLINNTINNIDIYYKPVFEYWNEKEIIIHKEGSFLNNILTAQKNLKLLFKKISDIYTIDEIKQAIDNYDFVLKSKNYYWTHKWTLWDFLSRGLEKFVESADPKNNFKNNDVVVKSYEDEYKKNHGDYLSGLE